MWSAAIARVLRTAPDEQLGYPDPAGIPALRATLASYLGRVRGVRAEPERVVVVGGLRHGVDLLWAALAGQGAQRVAVERPGWSGMTETATAAGMRLLALDVDGEGVMVERLHEQSVDAIALAPAHQYPTGAVLSPSRRTALLEWAREHGGLIVEDDYDAEYRYDRQPVGSLQGLAPEHVAYGGSTSKTLAPVVRLGWMVLPRRLVEPVVEMHRQRGAFPSPLLQLALADLIERGALDRHLRRQRRRYKHQREVLLDAIKSELPDATVQGAAAGLYVVLHLSRYVDEHGVLAAARSKGIALEGCKGPTPALVIGYANLTSVAVRPAIAALAASIRDSYRIRSGALKR
jgi:GntR family transcriptional regulator/MocR family aminotransferase